MGMQICPLPFIKLHFRGIKVPSASLTVSNGFSKKLAWDRFAEAADVVDPVLVAIQAPWSLHTFLLVL